MSTTSQNVLALKKKAAQKRLAEGRASASDYNLLGQKPPAENKPLGTKLPSGRIKLNQKEAGEQRKQNAIKLAEATKNSAGAKRTQALKDAEAKEKQDYIKKTSIQRGKTFYQGGKAPDPNESKKNFLLHPELKAPMASDEAREGKRKQLQSEHEARMKEIESIQKAKQATTGKGGYLAEREKQKQEYINSGYSNNHLAPEARKQEIERLEKLVKDVQGYGTSRVSEKRWYEYRKALKDLDVLKKGGLPKKRASYGAFNRYFVDVDASDPTLANLQLDLAKKKYREKGNYSTKVHTEIKAMEQAIKDRENELIRMRGEDFDKLNPVREFTPEEETEFEAFAAEATNATEAEIKNFENKKTADISDQVGGLSSMLGTSKPSIGGIPSFNQFNQNQFFKETTDEQDANTFLKLGEKFGISEKSIAELQDEQEEWMNSYKTKLNDINEKSLEAKKALMEAERIRHESSMRKARDKSREILDTSDERTNVILARFGAGDSTAAAALYTNNQKVFQEAITALDVEDEVFNQEMLAKQLKAQGEFDAKTLEIEEKYWNDKNTATSEKLKLAMDYFKEFLSYRDKKQSERFKVAELFMKEGLSYAKHQETQRMNAAFDLFDEYGSESIPVIADTLRGMGIDVSTLEGMKTFKQKKNEYDINKSYYKPENGTGGGGGSYLKGMASQYAHNISTGQESPVGAFSRYFAQFDSERLLELGQDTDEALFLDDASGFVEKYKQLGFLQVDEEKSTKRPLVSMIEDGTITFEIPDDFIEAVQDEAGAANSKYAVANKNVFSNYVRGAYNRHSGIMAGIKATPQYYEIFDETNSEGKTPEEMSDSFAGMGQTGQTYAENTFSRVPLDDVGGWSSIMKINPFYHIFKDKMNFDGLPDEHRAFDTLRKPKGESLPYVPDETGANKNYINYGK